jgi:hemerythrin
MTWSSSLSIGSASFDLARLETATYPPFRQLLDTLAATKLAGLDKEHDLMDTMDIPERIAHRAQHQPVLTALHGVAPHAARDPASIRL